MKKAGKAAGTFIFLSIAVVLLTIASYEVRPLTENFRESRITGFYEEAENSIDVAFFGSSAVYRFVNPLQLWDEYGFTAYNVASPSQPSAAAKYLIDETDKTQSPQLYVIECRRFLQEGTDLKEKQIRWVTDNMHYSLNRFKAVREMTENKKEKLPYYIDIIKYHDNWEDVVELSQSQITGKLNHSWEQAGRLKKGREKPVLVDEDDKMPLTQYQEEQLRELIRKCKSEGKEVLFFFSPYVVSAENQKKINYVRDIVEESGYGFLDCNRYVDEIGLDYNIDFYDSKHTNALGAKKVTHFVGEYIKTHYEVNGQHDEQVKEEWDQAAQNDRSAYEEAKEQIYKSFRESE